MLECIFATNRNSTASDRPYDGPYKVIDRGGRVMKILMKGKVEAVSVDRVKPAHFECEPETGTEIKRKTQPKTMNSKTAEIVRGTRTDRIRSSSTQDES